MMTIIYVVVAGVLGLIFLGLGGAAMGGMAGILYGSTQSNYRRIVKLEKEINQLKNDISERGALAP